MKKGIVVTAKNIATVCGHIKKVIKNKDSLFVRSANTSNFQQAKKLLSRAGKNGRAFFLDGRCAASIGEYLDSHIEIVKTRRHQCLRFGRNEDFQIINIGDKVFIDNDKVFISWALGRYASKKIACVS
ncbi:MAG: hypothetical protein LiPW41_675 [Parcubacteria group bacterium LiPW_41]|nr:MAG: hypothetical protein LiPW41_675 [Parcubacteria group bacterium LiPW_41]